MCNSTLQIKVSVEYTYRQIHTHTHTHTHPYRYLLPILLFSEKGKLLFTDFTSVLHTNTLFNAIRVGKVSQGFVIAIITFA